MIRTIGKPSYKTEMDFQMAGLAGGGMIVDFTFIPVNRYGIQTGYYTKGDLCKLLRAVATLPLQVRFIADMME
jgi:hypothetical protein